MNELENTPHGESGTTQLLCAKPRITVVLEYDSLDEIPSIGPATKDLGNFNVKSLQFSDALRELEVVREFARAVDLAAADEHLAQTPLGT